MTNGKSPEIGPGPEGEEIEEMPGKIYQTTGELYQEIQREDSKTLRIWGKKLVEKPSETIPGKTYHEIEDAPDDPEAHFDTRIHQIKNPEEPSVTRVVLNVFDYQKKDKNGRPELIHYFNLDPKNIQDWRIEVV